MNIAPEPDFVKLKNNLEGSFYSKEETDFILGFLNREKFAERFFLNRDGKPWLVRDYQRESLNTFAPRKVLRCGRDTGKTTEIEIFLIWCAITQKNREAMLATQLENHLTPTMERIISRIKANPYLSKCLLSVRRKPSYRLVFNTPFILWGKISGNRGVNFQNTHVDFLCVDEAQNMTEPAWQELHQALNSNGWRWVYGVPNGIRNTFYRLSSDTKGEELYHWQSYLNPDFTEERRLELIELYGGENSSGYIHQVLGEHGSPEYGVFDSDLYQNCIRLNTQFIERKLSNPKAEDIADLLDLQSLKLSGAFFIGCDLGYARDPTEIVDWLYDGSKFINFLRIHLESTSYDIQVKILELVCDYYKPNALAIDKGGSGTAVCHILSSQRSDLEPIIIKGQDGDFGVDFGSNILIGYSDTGGPALFRPAKVFMTDLIIEALRKGLDVFPKCPDRDNQYINHTYCNSRTQKIIYSKGNDHIIDADRLAHFAFYRTMKPLNDGDIELGAFLEEI